MVENILGYSIFSKNCESCISEIFEHIISGKGKAWLGCFNPHSYNVSLSDDEFSNALHSANWLVPDGIGVIYASRVLSGRIKKRITGTDIFLGLLQLMNNHRDLSIYFLGGSNDNLVKIIKIISDQYPNIKVAGFFSPPYNKIFSKVENEQMIDSINLVKPDVLWVSMTAPKQEKWVNENIANLNVKFTSGIGAALDFYTGSIRQPGKFIQNLGLEWLTRLMQEPRRLWRRTFISAPIFILHVLIQRFFR